MKAVRDLLEHECEFVVLLGGVAYHFVFDVVIVVEVKAFAGFVFAVIEGFETLGKDALFGFVKIIHGDGDVVQAVYGGVVVLGLGIGRFGGIHRDIGRI